MGEIKRNGSCAVERRRKEEMKVRRGQMLETCLPPGVMVKVVRSRLRREVCLPLWTMVMSGWAAANDHVWVPGPMVARVCVDVHCL